MQISVLSSNGFTANLEFKEIHEEIPKEKQEEVSEQIKQENWFDENKYYVVGAGILIILVLVFLKMKFFNGRR